MEIGHNPKLTEKYVDIPLKPNILYIFVITAFEDGILLKANVLSDRVVYGMGKYHSFIVFKHSVWQSTV